MFPLKILRLFAPLPETRAIPRDMPAQIRPEPLSQGSQGSQRSQAATWPEVERRAKKTPEHRLRFERREKQDQILLNTRTTQGRRRTNGRRVSDHHIGPALPLPISVEG